MEKSFLYWLIMFFMVLAWIFGGYTFWDSNRRFAGTFGVVGLFVFLLFLLIGLAIFGQPIK